MNSARWVLTFFVALLLAFATLAPVSSFEDPCADGSCAPPDPCADGSCPPPDPCADGSCAAPPDPCADGSCAPVCEEISLDSYRCSGNARQREKVTSDCITKQWFTVETCQYGCNAATATCNAKPACEEKFINSYRCSGNSRQQGWVSSGCVTEWKTIEQCSYGCDPSIAACRPVPVCTPGSRRWGSLPDTLSPSLCPSDWTAIVDCNQYGQWVFVDCVSPYEDTCTPSTPCSSLPCGTSDSCGNFCGSCPAPADNPPTATINVPASAAPSSQLTISVSGNDDSDVSQLQLYDANNNLLETFDCAGVQTSCSKTFTRAAPATPNTAYTFKAKSKDSANQLSAFVSGTGTTSAAPAVPPKRGLVCGSFGDVNNDDFISNEDVSFVSNHVVGKIVLGADELVRADVTGDGKVAMNDALLISQYVNSLKQTFPACTAKPEAPKPSEAPKPLQVIRVKFPLQPLFLRALNFPDSDCVRPGESALLAVKVQNTAKTALKDVKFTATVPELGIRASDGPVRLTVKDKLTRLLRLNIPEDAEEGTYYLRFSISNNKFNRIVHRTFVVDSSC